MNKLHAFGQPITILMSISGNEEQKMVRSATADITKPRVIPYDYLLTMARL